MIRLLSFQEKIILKKSKMWKGKLRDQQIGLELSYMNDYFDLFYVLIDRIYCLFWKKIVDY